MYYTDFTLCCTGAKVIYFDDKYLSVGINAHLMATSHTRSLGSACGLARVGDDGGPLRLVLLLTNVVLEQSFCNTINPHVMAVSYCSFIQLMSALIISIIMLPTSLSN